MGLSVLLLTNFLKGHSKNLYISIGEWLKLGTDPGPVITEADGNMTKGLNDFSI